MTISLIRNQPLDICMGIESKFTLEQITKFKRFEDTEIDRFLRKDFPFKETKIWLPEITREQFSSVRDETKVGIKTGIEDFLKNMRGEGLSLYVADLDIFYFDVSIKIRIKERLNRFGFIAKDLEEYSDYVCNSYTTAFIYNDSIHKFNRKFMLG